MTSRRVQESSDPTLQSSVRLLNGAKENDSAAWQRLVALYTPLLRHWAAGFRVEANDRDDLVQEVLCSVARKIGEFRRDDPLQSFRGWLRTITENKAIDYHRSRSRRILFTKSEIPQESLAALMKVNFEPDMSELSREKQILYEQAVAILRTEFRDETWRMFWAVVIEGASPSDVAMAHGVKPNVVYLAKSRALKRLRENFVALIEE